MLDKSALYTKGLLQPPYSMSAQANTVESHVQYPGADEHPAGADVIGDHACQDKPYRPEAISPQLIDAADAAQSVIWHDFLHYREPQDLVDGQAKVDEHHRQASNERLKAVWQGQAEQDESHTYADHHQVHSDPAPAQPIQMSGEQDSDQRANATGGMDGSQQPDPLTVDIMDELGQRDHQGTSPANGTKGRERDGEPQEGRTTYVAQSLVHLPGCCAYPPAWEMR